LQVAVEGVAYCKGGFYQTLRRDREKLSELVRLFRKNGFQLVKEKGSVRYYAKSGCPNLIRGDYHGSREVPTGTCNAILKAAGLK
jgi:predicted RNA binding protein YcfA (HicA-like mRNA interferase family)